MSFEATGIYPINWNFAEKFKLEKEILETNALGENSKINTAGTPNSVRIRKRETDSSTLEAPREIIDKDEDPSRILQKVNIFNDEQKRLSTT